MMHQKEKAKMAQERSISNVGTHEVKPDSSYLLRGAHSTKAGLWFRDGRQWHFFFRNGDGRYQYSKRGHGPVGEVSNKDQMIWSSDLIRLIEAQAAGAHIEATVEGEWREKQSIDEVLRQIGHRSAAAA